MGFGILFIGYLFTVFDTGILFIDSISVVFMQCLRLFGYAVVCIGCYKLSRYIKKFSVAFSSSLFLALLCVTDTVLHCLTVYGNVNIHVSLRTVIFVLYAFVYAYFHFYMLKGLCDITKETSLVKENKRSISLFNLTMMFCVLNLIASTGISETLTSVRYIIYVILTLANAYNVFTCYIWIGLPESEEDETEKDTGELPKKEKKYDKKRKK